MPPFRRAIAWIRRDIRFQDNTTLAQATAQAEEVIPLFVYDTQILDHLPTRADRRLTFIQKSLDNLHQTLTRHGSALLTAHGDPARLIPTLAQSFQADAVFTAHDDDPYAQTRDNAIAYSLAQDNKIFKTYKDHVVFERQEILTNSGTPFRVFTPFSRAWRERLTPADLAPRDPDPHYLVKQENINSLTVTPAHIGNHTLDQIGFEPTDLWLEPGETAAHERLDRFLDKVDSYGTNRNFPAIDGTSGLSVHLRHGTLSIRAAVRAARERATPGAIKWETELIWRDFYHMLLANFPDIGTGKAFKPDTNDIQWPGTEEHFQAWCQGQTGFPLVDAAMRCFNATGWMHNRLRMVTAMFLTKDLLVDWRKGERYFADYLLDFDLASNNGGWQWSASTGADAQPYFRVFNPLLQSEKFDPQAAFIKEWLPELTHLPNRLAHWPFTPDGQRTLETPEQYPDPVVLHKEQREKAIALFKPAP